MNTEIREIREKDIVEVVGLIREFAEYEKLSHWCEVDEEKLRTALFGEKKVADALVISVSEKIVGYAIYFPNFASFRGQRGIYLEDIYLKPDFRGANLGEKMLKHLAQTARQKGFERIDFQVLNWNKSAVEFYKKHGAVMNEEERHFKFADEAFQKLAS